MLNHDEVITHYKELKKKISQITDPDERYKAVKEGLNKYSLDEWCEVGDILHNAKLI